MYNPLKISIVLFILALIGSSCSSPKPAFNVNYKSITAPAEVEFTNLSENSDTFIWTIEDNSENKDTQFTHRFLMSGRYPVTLTAVKGKKMKSMTKDIYISPPEKCLVRMLTSKGEMIIELYNETPKHRDNFIQLAEDGFYDGLLFHRVIKGFMIQGGDPNSRNAMSGVRLGNTGSGYTIEAEIRKDLFHIKGSLAAARQGDQVNPQRASSGSQFYIVHGETVSPENLQAYSLQNGMSYGEEEERLYREMGGTPYLDGLYTIFGKVIEGLEIIDAIALEPTQVGDRPVNNIQIIEIQVIK